LAGNLTLRSTNLSMPTGRAQEEEKREKGGQEGKEVCPERADLCLSSFLYKEEKGGGREIVLSNL